MTIVGVMGSGKAEWEELASPLGVWLAESGYDLLTGAGGGIMLSVSRAFCAVAGRRGRSIGIVPTQPDRAAGFRPLDGYPNPFIEIPILTPLSRKEAGAPAETLSRNHVNILTSDVVVVLPGGHGTLDETRLALRFRKPVIGFGPLSAFAQSPSDLPILSTMSELTGFITAAAPAAS